MSEKRLYVAKDVPNYIEDNSSYASASVALTRENGCKSRKSERADRSKNVFKSHRHLH